jgi:hypothetical protein
MYAFVVGRMARLVLTIVVLLLSITGCAAVMDGKYVTKDGKESPFTQKPDRYEVPTDPTARY